MVRQLGQDEADVLLLALQRPVAVLAVLLLIAQREDGRQGVQLGGDVRLGARTAVSVSLQELPGAPGQEVRKTACLPASQLLLRGEDAMFRAGV